MAEGEEGGDDGVWMNGEDNPPDDLSYKIEAFLARLPPFLHVEYESDFRVWEKGISDGRVEATSKNREKFWRFWRAYFKPVGIYPYLEEVYLQTKTRVATVFSGRVCKGSHSRGK